MESQHVPALFSASISISSFSSVMSCRPVKPSTMFKPFTPCCYSLRFPHELRCPQQMFNYNITSSCKSFQTSWTWFILYCNSSLKCLQNQGLVKKVQELAARKGCKLGQLALTLVHLKGLDMFPTPGTVSTWKTTLLRLIFS